MFVNFKVYSVYKVIMLLIIVGRICNSFENFIFDGI